MRRVTLLLAVAVTASLLSSTTASAAIMFVTYGNDSIVGTNYADHIIGNPGNDVLMGRAANDIYHFDDGFGNDTLTETAFVKVGRTRLPGGTDTLSFSQYNSGGLFIYMIPQWGQSYNRAFDPQSSTANVDLGSSPVENAVAGALDDNIYGGPARNTYKGGPGGWDRYVDYGGCNPCPSGLPALAASDDTYKSLTSGTGIDLVRDYGGTNDRLDLRPLESSDVYFEVSDADADGTIDSLEIVVDDTSFYSLNSVKIEGYLSPLSEQQNGRIEQIIFSNETITSTSEAKALVAASANEGA